MAERRAAGQRAGCDGGTRLEEAAAAYRPALEELTRERVRRPGEIKRITVAVLVDGVRSVNDAGEEVWSPRPEVEIGQLRDLVRSAIGYDEARGDVVTVETLEFAVANRRGDRARVDAVDLTRVLAPEVKRRHLLSQDQDTLAKQQTTGDIQRESGPSFPAT